MRKNISPWLYQLRKDRVSVTLMDDITTDVAIVGAGIAGIATAFFTLKHTDKNVTLVERYKLAHGATGHNAGQVTSYFERGFASIAEEFGLEKAALGQMAIENAWELINEMYTDAHLDIPFARFLGHAGLSSFEQVVLHLENNAARHEAGIPTERISISEEAPFLTQIPDELSFLYTVVPQDEVAKMLETESMEFVAVLSYQKGCVNSALFCEEILLYLIEKYPNRFRFFEHTPIKKIVLHDGYALLDAESDTVRTKHVVLCTNGFNGMTLLNATGLDINTKFHHLIHGTVGFMSGYLEKMNKPPTAISYFGDNGLSGSDLEPDPYFYLTRRSYEYEGDPSHNLISVGGPDLRLEESVAYAMEEEYPDEMIEKIDAFVRKTYDTDPNKKIEYTFSWHGLMGYTRNGIRLIGPEPKNPVLLYNLGCNGVGILPSVYGGKRIAEYLNGEPLSDSIFDVPRDI